MVSRRARCLLMAAAVVSLPLTAWAGEDVDLPKTISWTAYGVGSSGHAHAVAIGSALKQKQGTTLRVLPGKNDLARLAPLRDGKVDFSLTGSDSVYAQEAIYSFGQGDWGPQDIRLLIFSVTDGSPIAITTAEDAGIRSLRDLKGKRFAWVKGSPVIQKNVEAQLRYAGLTVDDIVRVEVPSYAASAEAVIQGSADALMSAVESAHNLRLMASPRGLRILPVPADDKDGWERLQRVVPWVFPHRARGPAIPAEGMELASTPYPILVSRADASDKLAYNMTRALHVDYEDYKDAAPGANGWALDRQKLDQVMLPYHDGAIALYRELGVWTPEAQERQEQNLQRQRVLRSAWNEYAKAAGEKDGEPFLRGWMKARHDALAAAGMNPILETW